MADPNERCEPDFAAFIGIDWADQRHAWALQTTAKGAIEHGDIDHTPEAVDAWATELGRRFGGRPVAIALEQSRGALLFMLTKYAHFVLYPIHPTTLANYRLGFRPSGAKSDPSDAGLLLDLLVRHREKLRRLNPDTVETRTLQFLVEGRRKLVNDKTRYSNRLTACLKMYFPQVLDGLPRSVHKSPAISWNDGRPCRSSRKPGSILCAPSLLSITVVGPKMFNAVWRKSAEGYLPPTTRL